MPDVFSSPAWGSPPPEMPEPKGPEPSEPSELESALALVIASGEAFRQCRSCRSQMTSIVAEEYEMTEDETLFLRVTETCQECDARTTYGVSAAMFLAMEAARLWDQAKLAQVTLRTGWANRAADLKALDQEVDPDA